MEEFAKTIKIKGNEMKIKSIKKVGKHNVYDISVQDVQHYILENGVVTHNTGLIYSATQAFIIGKSQEKDGTELAGWNFTLNVEKSRHVKEKSKLTFTVTFDGGVQKYSGLLPLALESGHIIKPKNGWYQRVDMETGEVIEKSYREKQLTTKEFWQPILDCPKFKQYTKNKFQLSAAYNGFDEAEDDYSPDSYKLEEE